MSAPQTIDQLVQRFHRNRDTYLTGNYNEAAVRQEFINPFFIALGWDVYNAQGYAEAYKDVIHEDSLKIGAEFNAPDYSFRIGGNRKFFLEAKKSSVNLDTDIAPRCEIPVKTSRQSIDNSCRFTVSCSIRRVLCLWRIMRWHHRDMQQPFICPFTTFVCISR